MEMEYAIVTAVHIYDIQKQICAVTLIINCYGIIGI